MRFTFVVTPLLILFASSLPAGSPPGGTAEDKADLSQVPLPAGLVAPETKAMVAALVCFFEGPAVDENENVFFSDISGNRP